MSKDTRSFFERLTGTVRMDEETEVRPTKKAGLAEQGTWIEEEGNPEWHAHPARTL
jgi:hypothetical protein